MAKLLTLKFSHVFFKLCFLKISFSLQKEEYFWKQKQQKQKTMKQRWPSYWLMVAKLLTLQHIYIYVYICMEPSEAPTWNFDAQSLPYQYTSLRTHLRNAGWIISPRYLRLRPKKEPWQNNYSESASTSGLDRGRAWQALTNPSQVL